MTQASKTDLDGDLKIEQQLCFALYSTSRAITKQYAILLKDLGVTYPQYLALMVLWQQDGLLIQEIAKHLELDGATTTPLIQRMEKLELVTRMRSTEDERRVHVYLTDKGKALFNKAKAVPQGLGCAIGVDCDTAHHLIDELNKIKAFMHNHQS